MHTDPTTTKRIALVVLTRAGLVLALRLQRGLAADVHIYASPRAYPMHDVIGGLAEGGCVVMGQPGSAQGPHPATTPPPPPTDGSAPHLTMVGVTGEREHTGFRRGRGKGCGERGPRADPGCPNNPHFLDWDLPHPSITRFETVAPLLSQLWTTYDQIVLFFALGAVVRLIAPLLQHKHIDPGIVAIDDAGRFAISVVSGHLGAANELTQCCAEVLGAIPVVTTASDVHNTLAVDLLAHTQGWQIEDPSTMTSISAAIINGEAVAILQECAELDWWGNERPWPNNLLHVTNSQEVTATRFAALLVIADRLIGGLPQDVPTLVYRPPTLVLGIGCRRGVSFRMLDTFVKETLAEHQLAFQSIALLATADIKADEPALQQLAQCYGWSFATHAVTALRTMTQVPNPSERVQRLVGTPSVCEAAALLSSNGGTLIVPKQKGEGITVAIARRPPNRIGARSLNGIGARPPPWLLPSPDPYGWATIRPCDDGGEVQPERAGLGRDRGRGEG